QDAMRADLLNQILRSLGGAQTKGEAKTDLGALMGGILGGVLESQSPQDNQPDQKKDPGEAFETLLKGIFGN
ncbi:MAG TPA: hypothetical protein VLL07_05945, partial [Pontiella sp.]|nr:hypothetical protein [Pontiella sp.]